MMKHLFYSPPDTVAGDTVVFPSEEAHHALRVMRVKTGDQVAATDGEGVWYRVELEVVGRKSLIGRILERRSNVGEPDYNLTLYLAILKNSTRFEWVIEKAAELGVSKIVPVVSRRTEKSRVKASRLKGIAVAAMKQCGRSRVVELSEPIKFRKLMKDATSDDELKYICHETASSSTELSGLLDQNGVSKNSRVLVGPEGGFSEDELHQAIEQGYRVASLGPRRLRAETAAIVVATTFMMHHSSRSGWD
jgi:16S rRNA (uracil1498-N3)-methyltransferase